jgi:hypothetical protein
MIKLPHGHHRKRLQGDERELLVGLQRLLNVDGYQVIAVDDISGTVALNRQLLNKQFQETIVSGKQIIHSSIRIY